MAKQRKVKMARYICSNCGHSVVDKEENRIKKSIFSSAYWCSFCKQWTLRKVESWKE